MSIVKRFVGVAAVCVVLCVSVAANGRVDTVRFQSKLINATLPYNVILPVDYATARSTRYPVLYLLHGLTGHSTDWVNRTNIADYASEYSIIIVMPEGNDGWYTDSAIVPSDKYESYILKELLPEVEGRYRTIEARYGRAIAGLSMGGYGAIKFGLKSPYTFAFAASMSGAFAITHFDEKDVPESWRPSLKLFGPVGSDTRENNDLFEIIKKLPAGRVQSLPYFYFDCGTDDSASLIFNYNRELSALMFEKKIPHEYRELPGDHSWRYWDSQVQEVLRVAARQMPSMKPAKRRGV